MLFPLSLIVALFFGSSMAPSQVIFDDLNRPFPLGTPPHRIISLAPNITEILFALGLDERIVGVTRYCDFPLEAKEKEKIGGLLDPNLEKIEALRPDLIIAFRGNPLRLLNKLVHLGFPVFVLDRGKSLDDLFMMVQRIGQLTRKEAEATALTESLKKKYEGIREALPSFPSRPKVFLSLPGQKLWTCGRDSYLHDLIVKAGGTNIAGHIPREWLRLNPEHLIKENPDVIVLLARNEKDFSELREWYLKHPHLKTVQAIQKKKLYFLDENMASRFGPRLVEAYSHLACLLHPERFSADQ